MNCRDLFHTAVKATRVLCNTYHLHATNDINRLCLLAIVCVLHARNGLCEVNVHSQLAKVSFLEHFEVRRQEILKWVITS